MKEVYVNLETPDKVQNFVKLITSLDSQFDLVSDNHILDARSLMGIFTLNLSKPILLRIYSDDKLIEESLHEFIVK